MSVSVSTHVLDTGTGRPAAGVRVELLRDGEVLALAVTDGNGRVAQISGELEPGTYSVVFHPPSLFFTRVELQVELADGHHHLPLLVSPYGCVIYRGS